MDAFADLHTHTTASDGMFAPSMNVRLAKQAGLTALAITDHDSVAGVAEAQAEGKRIGIKVVPGVEISSVADGQDIHILGYYMDMKQPNFLERLQKLRDVRGRRNEMLIERLQQLGLNITMEDVVKNLSKDLAKGETIGRPHIADVLVRKGYVESMKEAFDLYLGKGGRAYVNPPRIRPEEAVDWIHEAGGAAVIAHPGLYHDDELVEKLLLYGVEGLEVYHSDHTPEDEARYLKMAEKHHVLMTAGSDFHGERHGVVFHAPIGARKVGVEILPLLEKKRGTNR